MTTPKPTPFTIGVLLIPPTQLLDLSPIDLFGMLTPSYLEACQRGAGLPAPLVALGVPVTIHYITASHQPSSPSGNSTPNLVELTSEAQIISTASLTTPSVQPGNLSALLIPGPDPGVVPSDAEEAFLRAHDEAGADILTVCTGILVPGYADILDGREVTGPRGLMGDLKQKFPRGRWSERRWVKDGNGSGKGVIWTSGTFPLHKYFFLPFEIYAYLDTKECAMTDVYGRRHNKWSRHGSSIYSREVPTRTCGFSVSNGGCWGKRTGL